MVGFESPKYFSTCFKSEFGVSPSEYLLSDKKEGLTLVNTIALKGPSP